MATVNIVVRSTLRRHPVVFRQPPMIMGRYPRREQWFCWRCLHYFAGPDPSCPKDILGSVPWLP